MRSNASSTRPLHSGELARLAGVSTDTLRYYERRRLLPAAPRSASGYRLFPPEALVRVKLIRGALSIGFSVSELSALFGERDRGGAPSVADQTYFWHTDWPMVGCFAHCLINDAVTGN